MIKNLKQLDKKILTILNDINKNEILHTESYDRDSKFAVHESIIRGYLDNVEEWKDANGDYHFEIMGQVQITGEGLKFVNQHAFSSIIKMKIGVFFKSAIGFIITIIVALIIAYLTYKFGWGK